jgi:4-alpha-glucanotransferase
MSYLRRSGILLHITSLPGPYGIGDLGRAAYQFVDFLGRANQRYWQFLALGPTNAGLDNSPYMSHSAFAGNPLLISPDLLQESGYIGTADLRHVPAFSKHLVDFSAVIAFKDTLFDSAFATFRKLGHREDFDDFCRSEQAWLNDYARYMSFREEFDHKPWYEWPAAVAKREPDAIEEWARRLVDRIAYHKFIQFCFYSQWQRLHAYAIRKGILLVGDIPFYVGLDSADVWANRDCFKLDAKSLLPTVVAGVPPDYFSATGQRWGNPVYRWKGADNKANKNLYQWWRARFRHLLKRMDMVRIDHFRGFESSWQIPAAEKTAMNGRWVKGPGKSFFRKIWEKTDTLPIIAEDLGFITPAVEKLLADLKLPGMKVLQFAFDSDENNPYLPHNYRSANCIVYTGTHDNDTTIGWYLDPDVSEVAKKRARRYANSRDNGPFNWDLIRLAFSSVAQSAIIPLQDVLGLGTESRMNVPSTSTSNWRWRCGAELLTDDLCGRLADETVFYGRAPAAEVL